jgi:anti-sigma regulatory factor (Ser/Thr protein kinase)
VNTTSSGAQTLHVFSLHLAAVPSAVPVSRAFVREALRFWKLDDHSSDVALMMSELASNAVKATGFADRQPKSWELTAQHVMAVQLRAVDDELFVEVWDMSPLLPIRRTVTAETEGGRGLHLVEALAKEWGVYQPPAGGKIVWAKVALTTSPRPGLDKPTLQLQVPSDADPLPGPVKERATTALLQRILDGLRQHL